MIVNLLNNNYITEYKRLQKLIEILKENYLSAGNDIGNFSKYLNDEGIRVAGMVVILDDKWDTYCALQGI